MGRICQELSFVRHLSPLDLGQGERLLIRSIRRWARNSEEWGRAVRDAVQILKPKEGIIFVNALDQFAADVDANARRSIRLRIPMCNRMSADERALLCLVGALHNNHNQHADALISYLILPVGQKSVYTNLDRLAKALTEGGVVFSSYDGLRSSKRLLNLRAVA